MRSKLGMRIAAICWALGSALVHGAQHTDTLPPAEVVIPGKYAKEIPLPEKQRFRPSPIDVTVNVSEMPFIEWTPEYIAKATVDTLPPLMPVLPDLLPQNKDFSVELGAGNFATLVGKAYWTAVSNESTILTVNATGEYTREKALVNRKLASGIFSARARHMPREEILWLPELTFRFKGFSYPFFEGFGELSDTPVTIGGSPSLNAFWDVTAKLNGYLTLSETQTLRVRGALWWFGGENSKEAGGDVSAMFRRSLGTGRLVSFEGAASLRAWLPATGFIVGVNPAYHHEFPNQKTRIKVGAIAFFSEKTYLFPDLYTEHKLLENRMIYFVRTTGVASLPSLTRVMYENPYFTDTQALQISDRFITETGITGYPTYDIEASVIIRYERDGNFPLYHWVLEGDKVKFRYLYARRMDVVSAVVGGTLILSDYLRANAGFTYYHYRSYDEAVPEAYNLPTWKSTGRVDYSPLKYLHTAVEWTVYGMRTLDRSGKQEPLAIEVNLHARMNYSEHLSFWFSIYNLLNHRHYIWYPYPAYGLWLRAGVTVSM